MLKKTITFETLDGEKITEDFYFHLSRAEVAEMELSTKGGLTDYLKKIVAEEDGEKLVAIFKDLLRKTVGKRSDDGRRFIKNQEITDDFLQTEAYSELFLELASSDERAAEFIKGVLPASMASAISEEDLKNLEAGKTAPASDEPAWLREGRTPTPDEVKNATPEQLQMAFQRKQADQTTPPA